MNVALGMLSEVDHQGVGMSHGGVEVVIETGVVHQQSQRSFVAVHLSRERVDVGDGLIHLPHGPVYIDGRKVGGEAVGVVQ